VPQDISCYNIIFHFKHEENFQNAESLDWWDNHRVFSQFTYLCIALQDCPGEDNTHHGVPLKMAEAGLGTNKQDKF
jgi:hypothetical protein